MLNSSKRSRLARVGEFINERGGGARVETENSNKVATLRDLVEAQRASIAYLEQMRAEPLAKRLLKCSPPESAERIFGDMALDLQLIEERRKLGEWEEELREAQRQQRGRHVQRAPCRP
jgi:hypothetical protein